MTNFWIQPLIIHNEFTGDEYVTMNFPGTDEKPEINTYTNKITNKKNPVHHALPMFQHIHQSRLLNVLLEERLHNNWIVFEFKSF